MLHAAAPLAAVSAASLLFAVAASPALAQEEAAPATLPADDFETLDLQGHWPFVHDPTIAESDGFYYVFSSHDDIGIRRSPDLVTWEQVGSVFDDVPAWAREDVPGVRSLWAPDIERSGDTWFLYYSASTFGSNRSAMGVATNKTLDVDSADYKWVDQGKVFGSDRDDSYNAIDPNLLIDEDGRGWLSFGSFWSGLKMIEVDPATGKPATDDPEVISIAARPNPTRDERGDVSNTAIEAPFMMFHDGWYYLFASYDFCCRGENATYNVRVGRSRDVKGPYVDADGVAMMEGGGTMVVSRSGPFAGPGHADVIEVDENGPTGASGPGGPDGPTHYLVHHAYEDAQSGRPVLRVSPLEWHDGWPSVPRKPPDAEPATRPAE